MKTESFFLSRVIRWIGSLAIAVPLLILIAGVLGWGTIYEARFGTAAVQRFVYHSLWFQLLLAFLAINLAVAALERYPWKRRHLPFVLAHLGIILILVGGILGARFGIEGQLIIPEGQAEHVLEQPGNVLIVRQPNPGIEQVFPTQFETQAWIHEPHAVFPISLERRSIQLTVDRYYPDAVTEEHVTDGGAAENPALHVRLKDREQQDEMWLLANDPERFGTQWGDAHVLFLRPQTEEQLTQLIGRANVAATLRGVVSLRVPGMRAPREIPVPEQSNQSLEIKGTRYRITFKDYFPDFAITEQGVTSRSTQPNNPAVSFTLSGPEGMDAYLLFALHPEFQTLHGLTHKIPAEVRYTHAASTQLPPQAITLLRAPSGALLAILTDANGERHVIQPLELGMAYTHPSLGYQFTVTAYAPHALLTESVTNRGDEIKAEALHLIGHEGSQAAEAWIHLRGTAELALGAEPITVEYRPAQRPLPVTIKLLNFRKIDYPGTQMASAFEADVELTDSKRGIILMRKITMNHPLRYRGFSFYQSSYIDGPTKTTVLSVRSDPGTPFVYAGFLVVIAGVVSMFVFTEPAPKTTPGPRKPRARTRSRAT